MKKVSVIIPLYNKERAILNTIKSVVNQSFSDIEIVIVDDGSTDNSAAIVKEYAAQDSRIKYFVKTNGGVSSARNFGLSKAVGDWVIFLDADDEMLHNNVELLLGLTEKYQVDVAAVNNIISDGNGKRESEIRVKCEYVTNNFFMALIRHRGLFVTGAAIYKRGLLGTSPYNERLSRYEDCEFELNILKNRKVAFSPVPGEIHHGEFAELSKIITDRKDKDFIFNMDFTNKTFWQKVYMGRFINEGCYTYNNGSFLLKSKYGLQYYWRFIYKIISKYFGAIYRIEQIIKSN